MLPHGWKDTCLFSPPGGPLRLDFYSTDLTISIMTEAAPDPIFGTRDQPAHYRIAVNITELLNKLMLAPYVEIMVSSLPERVCCP